MISSEEDKQKSIDRLVEAINKTYNRPGNLIWRGFLIGLASGLGATLGVAIVLTLAGFLLGKLGGLPWIGQFFMDAAQNLPNR